MIENGLCYRIHVNSEFDKKHTLIPNIHHLLLKHIISLELVQLSTR
jgi:hypothetical protein